MLIIPPISGLDAFFVGWGANDAFQALIDVVEEIREAVNAGPAISGGYRISVREDQGFTISMEEDAAGEFEDIVGGNAVFVFVRKDGGEDFDPDSGEPATWTYTVTSFDGQTLGTTLPQLRERPKCNVRYGDFRGSPAYGIGFFVPGASPEDPPIFKLWDAGEWPKIFECVPPSATGT